MTLPLWPHQREAIDFALERDGTMLAMEMGTAKSRVAIELLLRWEATNTLIICPKSVLPVWRREFDKWGQDKFKTLVLDSTRSAKKKGEQATLLQTVNSLYQTAVVINYDTAKLPGFAKFCLSRTWDCVILDESHKAKSHNSHTSKFCNKLRQLAKKRLCLTGTPMPHSPLDLFGQYRFLDIGIFGTNWHWFRSTYAVLREIPTVAAKVVVGFQNLDDLKKRMSRIAFRVDSSVLDLPDLLHHEVGIELSGRAKKIYDGLEKDFIAQVEDGVITAANAMVKLLRLQQVTSGCIRTEDEKVRLVDTSKEHALISFLLLHDGPVVVFCRFRSDLLAIQRASEQCSREYRELSGNRKDLDHHGCMLDVPGQVLGVQIQAGGVGVDLTRASHAVYFSIGYSLGDYLQSVARLHRPGQELDVHCHYLLAKGTIDEKVFTAIQRKQDVVESILEVLKRNHVEAV